MTTSLRNKEFYEKSIGKYGISPQGVHWSSKYTQYKRFEIITGFIVHDLQTNSIIDAGCGFGEYYNYLTLQNIANVNYIGIDCESKMIEICQKRFSQISFYKIDILNDILFPADYYICSGAMNILNKKDFYHFIDKCFEMVNKGFIFNFLKNRSFNKITIEEVLAYCSSLTHKIKTKNNYLDNDFTIFMIK